MLCLGQRRKTMSESIGSMLLAAAVGATAAILSDARRREEIRRTVRNWLVESGEKMEEVRDTAGRIKKAVEKEVKKSNDATDEEDVNPFDK